MSSREFAEWMAYSNLEPFGAPVEDLRHASLIALLLTLFDNLLIFQTRLFTGKRRKAKKIHPDQFLLGEKPEPENEAPSFDLAGKIKRVFTAMGAVRKD